MKGLSQRAWLALKRIHPASRVSSVTIGQNGNEIIFDALDGSFSPSEFEICCKMDRRNKISVTTMLPSKRSSSTPTPEERGGDFAANPRDMVGFEGLEMLAHVSLAWMTPEEAARVQAAEVAEAATHGAVNTLHSMSIYDDQMSRVSDYSDAIVSQPEPKSD